MEKRAVNFSSIDKKYFKIFKNQGFLFILFSLAIIFMFIFFIKPVYGEDVNVPEVVPGLTPENIEKVQTGVEKLSDEEIRKQYLSQEWGKILANNTYYINYIKPFRDSYNKISPYTDPFFRYTIGMAPSLSWLFLLAFVLWIGFVFYIFRISELVSFLSEPARYIISICFILLISLFQINKKVAEQIIRVISAFDTTKQLIAIGVVIIIIILLSIFSKVFRDLIKSFVEKKEKDEEKINRQRLKSEIKVAETFTKGITK